MTKKKKTLQDKLTAQYDAAHPAPIETWKLTEGFVGLEQLKKLAEQDKSLQGTIEAAKKVLAENEPTDWNKFDWQGSLQDLAAKQAEFAAAEEARADELRIAHQEKLRELTSKTSPAFKEKWADVLK